MINIDSSVIIDALLGIVGFLALLQLKDIKTAIKELKSEVTEHGKKLVRIETKLQIEDE